MTAPMQMAREEREDFAALLDQLTPEQWDQPSLCTDWRVRDVVAHVISYEDLSRPQAVARMALGLLRHRNPNAIGVALNADKSPSELTALMRKYARPRGSTAGFDGRIALTDGMVHQQDIRRPLDMPRLIKPERLVVALEFTKYAPFLRGAWRARGLRLVATDLDWTHGSGPEVRGSGEALLMAMAGRGAALSDLDGPGKARLAQRL
ncbi:DinB family protein [Mycobacterium lehmannii]|uniref:DinB family protein n=1 Tax=Mycobacterium lehmannii TaxID=2048550 RepID=A0A124EPB6_9MYCO|nr:maleylpyruvate isomerase family mycothiol-dependent enzyme [Mycobacterium lehmannii]KUI14394.1 DinB family protein [Mycobacterium lehmannii]